MNPPVSVVIPCYAQAHFLADAIDSVFRQDYPSLELVVVNDGSPDTTLLEQVVTPLLGKLDYCRQENLGLPAARNAGLSRCRGEYIIFLDADDRLLPNAVADGVAALRSRPECGLVWGHRHLIDADGVVWRRDTGTIGTGERYIDLLVTNIVGPPVGVMWRRSMLLAIGGFSSMVTCAEDYDGYLRIAQRHEIHCHGKTVAEYRVHGANMSSNNAKMFAAVQRVLAAQVDWAARDPRLRRALRAGHRDARHRYVWIPRIEAIRQHVEARRWWQAWMATAFMLARYPAHFPQVLIRHAPKVIRFVLTGSLRPAAPAAQVEVNSGIGVPSTPVISTPSSAASVGARSSVETIRPI